jgi:hypothetical protein
MKSDPSLALQAAIGQRLIESPEVLEWIPADNILATNGRPERVPCLLIGEGQSVFKRFGCISHAVIHGWQAENGLVQAKRLGSAIVAALTWDAQVERAVLPLDGWDAHDLAVTGIQYMRDPHANYSHCIVTLAAVLKERVP